MLIVGLSIGLRGTLVIFVNPSLSDFLFRHFSAAANALSAVS
jgi:hypothetical protein